VSAIIVTCAASEYLKKCLDSLKAQTHPASETLVIDNSLNKDFNQDIGKTYSYAELFFSQKKLSYCDSLNKGIDLSEGDFLLCLNDDVILDPRFIEEALRGFLVDSRIGMVSGKILRSDGKTIDSTGLFLSFFRTAKERGYSLQDNGQFDKESYIFGVNGAVAFYRKEMLGSLKEGRDYFDSRFNFFYEDLDISWRANRSGWRGYYMPSAVAYHVRGGTLRSKDGIDKPFARRFLNEELHLDLIKNRYLTIIKNESGFGFFLHLPGIMLHDLLMWGYILIFRPKLTKMFAVFLKNKKSSLKKREIIKNN